MAGIVIKKAHRVMDKETKESALDKALMFLEEAVPGTEVVEELLRKVFPDVDTYQKLTGVYWWRDKLPKGSRVIVEINYIYSQGGYASVSYPIDKHNTKRATVEASAKYPECAIIMVVLKLHKKGLLCL